ncbi:DUF7167 family protein [Paenibacillus apis]|uniref:DUF7167 domain-containing protein n=1 Tax=Paenibacillus apis TaxID=1792174 RepID=A0A919Y1Q2_9BACL|nr:hypothetical protein [Paenibacillus apis]GIO42496.1 hypothetical protein J41TS4_22540 [Paenibacillus apis]
MAKFKFTVSTGFVGSRREETIEIPDEDLEGLDEHEREHLIQTVWEEWLWDGNIDGGWVEVEE